MLTVSQIRAARAMLRWTAQDLADAAGVGVTTIRRLDVMDGVPIVNIKTLLALKAALESAGVEFVGTPDDRPGVRLAANKKQN